LSAIQLFDLNGQERFNGTSVGGGGSQTVLAASVSLSSPQILALHTTPVTVAAARAGQIILPLFASWYSNYGTAPYVVDSGDPFLRLGAASSPFAALAGLNLVLQAVDGLDDEWVIDRLALAGSLTVFTPNVIGAVDVNQPLTMRAGTAITGGDGTVTGQVFYVVQET
jgi:hypothetical protein